MRTRQEEQRRNKRWFFETITGTAGSHLICVLLLFEIALTFSIDSSIFHLPQAVQLYRIDCAL